MDERERKSRLSKLEAMRLTDPSAELIVILHPDFLVEVNDDEITDTIKKIQRKLFPTLLSFFVQYMYFSGFTKS